MMVSPSPPATGEVAVPGDKSVTVRAAFLGLICPVAVAGPSRGGDGQAALGAALALGATPLPVAGGWGLAPGPPPAGRPQVDAGNSATTARFALGWAAGGAEGVEVGGDASLCSRQVGPLLGDLEAWGAGTKSAGGRFPAAAAGPVRGPLEVVMEPGSGTRKGALLLAAARSGAHLAWQEEPLSRDHSERLLHWAGVRPRGRLPREPLEIKVPPDASAFAALAALAAMRPESAIVGETLANPRRAGLLGFLRRVGASVAISPLGGSPEPVARVEVSRAAGLREGELTVEGQALVDMIDEIPLAAVVAAGRPGKTVFRTAGLLRNKETDRLAGTARLLCSLGAQATAEGEDLVVEGRDDPFSGGAAATGGDHRLVIAAAVAGAGGGGEVEIGE